MSTLKEIFQDLSYGELQGIAIGNLLASDNESEPDPKNYAQLISHINAGMRKLYARFFCREKEIIITQDATIETYYLKDEFGLQSGSSEPVKYITDTVADPFDETSLFKIEQVRDFEDTLLKLNNFADEDSVHTPAYNALQFPVDNEFGLISVKYRAAHDNIIYAVGMDINATDVPVPVALYNALLLYVAYRAMPRLDGGVEKAQFFQLYDDECTRIEQEGLHPQTESGNWRFDAKGWV